MAGQLLAYLCVAWPVLSLLWNLADNVVTTVYHSQFFKWVFVPVCLVLQVGVGIAVLAGAATAATLAWCLIVPFVIALMWEIAESPYDRTVHDKFYGVVSAVAGVLGLVLALIVLL